jgi:digeranylgeranylglycerophospholipid reductase
MRDRTVAVLGGAVGGLAAAERLRAFGDVTLFERESYADKRVNCGEAVNEAELVPLEKTPENGFLNRVEGFDLDVHASTDREPGAAPLTRSRIGVENGYITDRNVVERRWAERLAAGEGGPAVDVRENENVTRRRYDALVDEYDVVVDATGQPALSLRAAGRTEEYTGDMVALNADVAGDFSELVRTPRIVFEGYVGYFWVFPKSATRANVGIGWAGEERPDDYTAALAAACEREGVPVPSREATNVYTIPRGPSLDPTWTHPEGNVFLVGDAAGIANRYQGEGICQAIRSANLLADLLREGRGEAYPAELYRLMRSEYRLATLMRGVWEESGGDAALLAAVAAAIDGLTVTDVTRRPRAVVARIARRPGTAVDLLRYPGFRRRLRDAYTDRWEYTARTS